MQDEGGERTQKIIGGFFSLFWGGSGGAVGLGWQEAVSSLSFMGTKGILLFLEGICQILFGLNPLVVTKARL